MISIVNSEGEDEPGAIIRRGGALSQPPFALWA